MLYFVTEYDARTRIAKGIAASRLNSNTVINNGWLQNLYSRTPLRVNETYSFNMKDRKINGSFVRGELDYKNPNPIGVE